jgi:hypothetical protein
MFTEKSAAIRSSSIDDTKFFRRNVIAFKTMQIKIYYNRNNKKKIMLLAIFSGIKNPDLFLRQRPCQVLKGWALGFH